MGTSTRSTDVSDRDDFGILLTRRLALSAVIMLIPLVAFLVLAASMVITNRADTRFHQAFEHLRNATHEVAFDLAAVSRDGPAEIEARFDRIDAHFDNLLSTYIALRVSDPDGERLVNEGEDEEDDAELAARLLEAARARGIEPRQTTIDLGIDGAEMPEALAAIWEAEDENWAGEEQPEREAGIPLELSMARTLDALVPLVLGDRLRPGALAEARRVVLEEMGPSNHDSLEALGELSRHRLELSAQLPLYCLAGIAAVLVGGMAIVFLRVLRPFARALSKMQRDLERAREEALESERAKSEFLASMSHEIRTPMNGVMGMAELMAGTRLDTRQKMFIEIIQSSAHSLLRIINDILDFSKIDAGRMELKTEPFRLSRLTTDSVQLVSEQAAAKGIDLVVRLDPQAERSVVGDFGRLRQVVTNILGNAVKFTERGQVEIELAAGRQGDDVLLEIEVRDTGIGIPAQKLATIFDRFTQIDQSASRAHDGTGLGLAISKGLVEAMGGTIEVASTLNVGTRFRVAVPLGRHAGGEPRPALPHHVRGRRILVIDDNETNRLIVEELLGAWGFDGDAAASGREGLQRLLAASAAGRSFDLVLLDRHMPGMDGLEVARRIGETPELAGLGLILLTSIAEDLDGETCARLGIGRQLVKPVLSSPLLDAITGAIGESDAAEAGVAAEQGADPAAAAADAMGGTVLVVEDSRVNRLVVEQMMTRLGIGCVSAPDGFEGVERFRSERPDAILMDVSMPGIDGYETTARIRRIEAEAGLPRTPIIGVTAHALAGDRDRCLERGMDDYLPKPVSVGALRDTLGRHLAGAAGSAAA